jgi:hypothetical protein
MQALQYHGATHAHPLAPPVPRPHWVKLERGLWVYLWSALPRHTEAIDIDTP